MEAINAMIVWQPLLTPQQRCLAPFDHPTPTVRVFDNRDQAEHRRNDYLPCSLGACTSEWTKATDLLPHIFSAFLSVADDGVPIADIHREFLKIDLYAAMNGGREMFGVTIPDELEHE